MKHEPIMTMNEVAEAEERPAESTPAAGSPRVHTLKTWPEYFVPIEEGVKTFEIRKNDRDYQVGDKLVLKEWLPSLERFTCAPEQIRFVTFVTDFEQKHGFVVLGLSKRRPKKS